jgi:hypothetical protein
MTTTDTTSTTSATATRSRASAPALAASAKFKAFALGFAIAMPIMYVICDLFSLPLFTYHPATNMFGWGYERGRSGEGPAMYWYGWTAMCLVVCTVAGLLATMLPEKVVNKIPLMLLWLIPTLAFIPLAYSLMPFWTKG